MQRIMELLEYLDRAHERSRFLPNGTDLPANFVDDLVRAYREEATRTSAALPSLKYETEAALLRALRNGDGANATAFHAMLSAMKEASNG